MNTSYIISSALFVVVLLLGFTQCADPPDYPNEPVIEFISLSKSYMEQSDIQGDSLTATISFTDGDGNLGSQQNQSLQDVFIYDSRDSNFVQKFRMPFIPLEGAGNGISGEIDIRIYTTCCIYMGENLCATEIPNAPDTDTLTYLIQIMDRDSNMSNIVESTPLILGCVD